MKKSPKIEHIIMDMPPVDGIISGAPSSLTSSETSRKRRKILDADEEEHPQFSAGSSIVHLNSNIPIKVRPETMKLSPLAAESEARCNSLHTEELLDSCCSSNGSTEEDDASVGFLDLEVESAQVETSTCNCSGNQRRDMSLTKTNKSEEIMESSAEKTKEKKLITKVMNPHLKSTGEKRPSDMELEEFFGAAEKEIQKQFADKYNYDIVNDVPLEGRYEWVKLKP